jgi:hypothetical protein
MATGYNHHNLRTTRSPGSQSCGFLSSYATSSSAAKMGAYLKTRCVCEGTLVTHGAPADISFSRTSCRVVKRMLSVAPSVPMMAMNFLSMTRCGCGCSGKAGCGVEMAGCTAAGSLRFRLSAWASTRLLRLTRTAIARNENARLLQMRKDLSKARCPLESVRRRILSARESAGGRGWTIRNDSVGARGCPTKAGAVTNESALDLHFLETGFPPECKSLLARSLIFPIRWSLIWQRRLSNLLTGSETNATVSESTDFPRQTRPLFCILGSPLRERTEPRKASQVFRCRSPRG